MSPPCDFASTRAHAHTTPDIDDFPSGERRGFSSSKSRERLAWRISAAAGIIPVPLRPIRADFNYDTREVLRLLLDTTQNDGALRFSLFTTASLYLYRCISISRTKYRVEVKRFGRFLWLSPNRGRRDEARARFDARRRTHSL